MTGSNRTRRGSEFNALAPAEAGWQRDAKRGAHAYDFGHTNE